MANGMTTTQLILIAGGSFFLGAGAHALYTGQLVPNNTVEKRIQQYGREVVQGIRRHDSAEQSRINAEAEAQRVISHETTPDFTPIDPDLDQWLRDLAERRARERAEQQKRNRVRD